MDPAFYINARGEWVLSYPLFKTLDPNALAAGRIVIREGVSSKP